MQNGGMDYVTGMEGLEDNNGSTIARSHPRAPQVPGGPGGPSHEGPTCPGTPLCGRVRVVWRDAQEAHQARRADVAVGTVEPLDLPKVLAKAAAVATGRIVHILICGSGWGWGRCA